MDLPPAVIRAIREKYNALVEKRRHITRDIDVEIAQLESFLDPVLPLSVVVAPTQHDATPEQDNPRTQNRLAVEACQVFLHGGKQIKAPELYAMVEASGIKLTAQDPVHRLVQLLSERKEIFQSDRKHGWSLRGEVQTGGDPSATSSATQSV